ncbi:hypothetical protein TL16_g11520 [Triparma laevis f. inornata]|uniref:Uncharacterized protein n=1 Tax=Triparma laevis f. inornata TaxID=1714386 RepID=A0A9W7BFT7_9STRA|nr:hypothetical protein TL16_g11520 [Triparma laevis f. inornata]
MSLRSSPLLAIPRHSSPFLATPRHSSPLFAIPRRSSPLPGSPQNSPQTNPGYRVIGKGKYVGTVTQKPLVPQEGNPMTVLAFANTTLFVYAVGLLGITADEVRVAAGRRGKVGDDNNNNGDAETEPPPSPPPLEPFPFKFSFLGKGESSGKTKWNIALKQVDDFYRLFKGTVKVDEFARKYKEFKVRSEATSWEYDNYGGNLSTLVLTQF